MKKQQALDVRHITKITIYFFTFSIILTFLITVIRSFVNLYLYGTKSAQSFILQLLKDYL